MVINGIMFRTRTGCPWRDLPGEYGNWKTAYNRHRRWSLDGMWQGILDRLRAGCDEAESLLSESLVSDLAVSPPGTESRARGRPLLDEVDQERRAPRQSFR